MFNNGDIYDGEWFDDRMTGEGTMIYGDHHTSDTRVVPKYVGFWRNNLRDGYGTMVKI